jgi:hypothetical protein
MKLTYLRIMVCRSAYSVESVYVVGPGWLDRPLGLRSRSRTIDGRPFPVVDVTCISTSMVFTHVRQELRVDVSVSCMAVASSGEESRRRNTLPAT